MEDYSNDLPSVLSDAEKNGVCSFVVIGFDFESSKMAMELARRYGSIYPVYGIHPYDVKRFDKSVFSELEDLIREFRPVAIGETGLDYYRDISPRDKQKSFFIRHLELADKYELPVVMHIRDAFDDSYAIVKESGRKKDILHCFTGTSNDIRRFNTFDVFFGITGIITFKNNPLSDIVDLIPDNRLLVETDSPYLTPVPYRGKRNSPANLNLIVSSLAEKKAVSVEKLEKSLISNTREAYRTNFDEC